MTNRKPITRTSAPVLQPTKLDAATLSNMAHQPEPSGVHDDALQRIIELLTQLSPSNLQMVKNIIRAIVDQQTPEN